MKRSTSIVSMLIALAVLLAVIPASAGDLGPRASGLALDPALPAAGDPGGSADPADRDLPYRRRSPILAGAISLVLPGAGQIYNEQYVVGSLWLAGEIGLYLAAFAYAGAFTPGEEFAIEWKLESSILIAVAAGFHLFSIFDAVTEAVRVNENLDKFSVAYNPNDGAFSVGYALNW